MKKKKTLYKQIRELGFDVKFSKKISQRKDGLFEKVRLEELLEKYKGDVNLTKKVFEGHFLTKKEVIKFINGEERERKFFKGKYAGEMTKEEKKILLDKFEKNGFKSLIEELGHRTVDFDSRFKRFHGLVGRNKIPPKHIQKEWIRINKLMGASASIKGKPGMFVLREMMVNGLTEREAIEFVRERQNPMNKDEVFYS